MRVLVAGSAGAIGIPLVRQLIARGHQVVATTRRIERAERLRGLGATVTTMDGLDAASVGEAVARAEPDAIIHQMTALSGKPDFRNFDRWFAATNALRTTGTRNLLAAAQAAGVDVPGELSVVGFDDLDLTRLTSPALTTVSTDPEGLGAAAFELLHARLRGEQPANRLLPVGLVVRDSTGPARR